MSKRKIGIPGWSIGPESFGATKSYLNFFSQYGLVKILSPQEGVEDIDLLVLSGGQDLYSNSYNEVPGFMNSGIDHFKQYFFDTNLIQYLEKGTPVFAICLGIQMLQAFWHGKLIQDFPFVYSNHRDELVEELTLEPELGEVPSIKKHKVLKINSLHHQGISPVQLAPCLVPLGYSKTHGNVEVLRHESLPVWGVQYHPEEIHDKVSDYIIRKLLE